MTSSALAAVADPESPSARLRTKLAAAVSKHAPDLTAITSALAHQLDDEERHCLVGSTLRDWVRNAPEFRTAMPRLGPLSLQDLSQPPLPPLPDLPPIALRPLAIGSSGDWNWFLNLTGTELRIAADAQLASGRTTINRGEHLERIAALVGAEETVEHALRGRRGRGVLKAIEETD